MQLPSFSILSLIRRLSVKGSAVILEIILLDKTLNVGHLSNLGNAGQGTLDKAFVSERLA